MDKNHGIVQPSNTSILEDTNSYKLMTPQINTEFSYKSGRYMFQILASRHQPSQQIKSVNWKTKFCLKEHKLTQRESYLKT
jgi:hypothetical protein